MSTYGVIVAGYAVLLVAAFALTIWARLRDRDTGPGAILDSVLRYRLGRGLVLLAWLWTGWHLFVR